MSSLKYIPVPYTWKPLLMNDGWPNHPLCSKIEKRIHKFMLEWEGTPYISGQMMKGSDGGADCIRFLAAFVDQMTGKQHTSPERLPQDYSMHTRTGAISAMRRILRLYPVMRPVKGKELQPGDVLAVGPKDGGPSHCMIVGVKENTLWHAINGAGVCWTGWGLLKDHQKVFRAYRFTNRSTWGWIS